MRVGPDWPDHPIVGKPVRSHEFGGRPLGAIIARYARGATPDGTASSIAPRDARDLRIAHIRKSFDLVRSCVRASGRTMADIDRILVVGGAARPAEVARTVAELGRPVVMSADPGQCCAAGAAHFAARVFAPADIGGHRTPKIGVFSSAAVASALAMSAATVFGGAGEQDMSPVLEILPGAEIFADGLLYDPHGDSALDRVVRQGLPLAGTTAAPVGNGPGLAALARTAPMGPSIAESGRAARPDPRSCCAHLRDGRLYADPAHFVNPLPFNALNTARSVSGKPISWPDERQVPHVSLPGESTDSSGTPRHSQTAPDSGAGSGAPSGTGGGGASGGAGSVGGGASSGTGAAADSGGGASDGQQNSGESGASSGDGDSSNGAHGSDSAGSGGAGSGGAGSGASGGSPSEGGASGDGSSGGSGGSGTSGGGASGGSGGPSSAGSDSGGAGSGAPGGASEAITPVVARRSAVHRALRPAEQRRAEPQAAAPADRGRELRRVPETREAAHPPGARRAAHPPASATVARPPRWAAPTVASAADSAAPVAAGHAAAWVAVARAGDDAAHGFVSGRLTDRGVETREKRCCGARFASTRVAE